MAADKYVCTLSPELQEKAKTELFEKEEWRNRDIQALRERVLNNKALTCRTDSHFLLRYLRARKFDYERSYKLLENYFRMRAENVEHFGDLKPSIVPHVWDAGITQMLPKRDKLGRSIMYFRPGRWDPSKYTVFDILKANAINMELAIQDEETQVNGIVFLGNAEGVGWDHAKNLSREYFKLMTSLMQEAFPGRLKKLCIVKEPGVFQYIFALAKPFIKEKLASRDSFPCRLKAMKMIKEPTVMSYIFGLIKPFLKDKLASRIQFHGSDVEGLTGKESSLSLDVLPAELGGALPHGDELAKKWKDHVMTYEQYFVDQQQYKLVIPRNISSSATSSKGDVSGGAGLTGTFKKLNVD